jgi:hypothetical protein
MKRGGQMLVKAITGILCTALYAMPQGYTISARPGVVNYIEGDAYRNNEEISGKSAGKTFLDANDTISTHKGKAEVLLTPGVFLRVGENSEIKMISPSLTNTEVEVTEGEAMLEVAELSKDNDIQILDNGGTTRIEKTGLYRFTADSPPTAAVIQGKAQVQFGEKKVQLGKDHETVISDLLKPAKFDSKKDDDLYAWSMGRDQYISAASYASAKSAASSSVGGGFGYGFGSAAPGWSWNSNWNSWAWLPGNGAFFSPFGYGFFAPVLTRYAPLVYVPIRVAGHPGTAVAVPVNFPNSSGLASSGHVNGAAIRSSASSAAVAPSSGRHSGGGGSGMSGGHAAGGGHR